MESVELKCSTWNKKKVQEYFNVSRETIEKFEIYYNLLNKWQPKINLVSNGSLEDFWGRHLADSLQILPLIDDAKSILDVGSGAGFPGAVVAMISNASVFCVDSDYRKCCFLQEVFLKTKTDAKVINDRIESVKLSSIDYVVARGFSSLNGLLKITNGFGAKGVYLKGKKILEEIEEAKKEYVFNYQMENSITNSDGRIIKVSNIHEKSSSNN